MSDFFRYKFDEIAEFSKCFNYSSLDYTEDDSGIMFITIKSILKGGGYDKTGLKTIRNRFTQHDFLNENDLLIAITDLTRDGDIVGSPIMIPKQLNGSVASMDLVKIIPNKSIVNPRYLYYFLMIPATRRYFVNHSSGSTVLHLETKSIPKLNLLLPSLDNQERIANILSTIDEVIEKTEATIEKYKSIKAGMMQDLFTRGIDIKTGKLRPSYQESPELYKKTELGWIPMEWEVKQLSNLSIEIIDGDRGANYPHEDELFEDGYCLFLSANNVTISGFQFNKKVFISREKEYSLGSGKLLWNDIIVTTRGTVGNMAFFSDDVKYEHLRINSGMLILRNQEIGLTSEFLFLSLNNYLFDIGFRRVVSGSAQPQLPIKDIKSFLIVKPNISEQKLITVLIQCIDYKLDTETSSLRKITNLKKGLMADLLSGKLRVITKEDILENN